MSLLQTGQKQLSSGQRIEKQGIPSEMTERQSLLGTPGSTLLIDAPVPSQSAST